MSKEQQNRDRLIDYALGEHDFCLGYKALDNRVSIIMMVTLMRTEKRS